MKSQGGNGWRSWVTPAVLSMLVGVVSTAAVINRDVARHEKAIEALQVESIENKIILTRIDERLRRIQQDVAEIKDTVQR